MSLFDRFRRTPEQIVRDYTVADHEIEGYAATRSRHEQLLSRGAIQGLDPGTLILLIQLFGPLAVALIKALVAWLERS